MAALTLATGHKNQSSRRSVAKPGSALGPRRTLRVSPPAIPTHTAAAPPIARRLTLAQQAATPMFAKSRTSARTTAATASYNSMLRCYKRVSPFSSHSSLTTSHCLFNRQPRRLESTVTHTKEIPATQINRQLSGTVCSVNRNSPITHNAPSNRQWQILEFTVSSTKQTPASRSNRQFLRSLNLQIQHSRKLRRTRARLEARPSTLLFQPSPSLSNRNNASFKIPGNSLKINVERNPNRNTNRESRPAFHKSAITRFLCWQTPAPAALTAQHASPTMKMRRSERSKTALVAAAFRRSPNTASGTLITTH
jgi:hypothetical protein